ncbi:MAG: TRAP transporter small permease [Clostridiales Family XIII bacterium]|nr:TRAP transporter small permease [Clostridiales Family XIII bacterium]
MKKVFDILDWIINKFTYIGGAAVVFIMIYTTINTILRAVGHPLNGDMEITVSALVVVVYMTIASCLINDAHIKIELFKKLPWFDHINNLVAFGISLLISFETFKQVGSLMKMNIGSTLLHIPRWPFTLFAAVGFLLFALAVLSVEYRMIVSRKEARLTKHEQQEIAEEVRA